MTRPAPDTPQSADSPPLECLTAQERAVFEVLHECTGRVVGRAEIARRAGLTDLSTRRCDSLIAGIRRRLGADRVHTVRRRGWMLVA